MTERSTIFSKEQINDLRTVVLGKIKFSELMRENTKVDEIGGWFAVQCPFHQTNTTDAGRLKDGNMNVGEEGVYFCNHPACSISGDPHNGRLSLTSFWKEYHDFPSEPMAVIDLYQNKLGLKLPVGEGTPLSPEEKIAMEKERTLKRLLIHATYFYHKTLLAPEGKETMDYIVNERKIPLEYVHKYRLGSAIGGTRLKDYLISQGFTIENIREAKLLSKKDNDLYYKRVIFPLVDVRQNLLDSNFDFNKANVQNLYSRFLPKYLKEDNEYLKHRYTNRNFPLFNFADAKRKTMGLMIEGCFDTVAAQVLLDRLSEMEKESKIPDSFKLSPSNIGPFASYGTNGFKEEVHVPVLNRANYDILFIAGDNDKNFAGQEANIKRAKMLQNSLGGTQIRIVTWGSKDVNTLLQEGIDPLDFLSFLENSVSLEEYEILVALEKSGPADLLRNQFEAMHRIEDLLINLDLNQENSLLKYMKTLNTVAQFIGVDVDTILMHVMLVKHKKDLENAAANANVPLKTLLLSELTTINTIFGEG